MKRMFVFFIIFVFTIGIGSFYFLNRTGPEQQDIVISPQKEQQVVYKKPFERETPEEEVKVDTQAQEEVALPDKIIEAVQWTVEAFPDHETQIVAVGDSLTEGFGDTSKRGGYVGILDRTLNEERQIATINNFGKRGISSTQLLQQLNKEEVFTAIKDSNIILITIGANDLLQVVRENIADLQIEDFAPKQMEFGKNVTRIIEQIQEINSSSRIYLIGFYNPFDRYFSDIKELNMIVDSWNNTTRLISERYSNLTFIPTDDLFQDEEINLLAEDNFHPNYIGYHRIAARVLAYITKEKDEEHVHSKPAFERKK
jgi:lysophospholipase L1-like esterase